MSDAGATPSLLRSAAIPAAAEPLSAAHRAVAVLARLPVPMLASLVRLGVGRSCVAICLHQIRRDDAPPHPFADTASREGDVDLLVSRLAGALAAPHQLCVTFDDGYAAAAEFVRTRAPQFPAVDWLYFVCPLKTETRVGFGWDAKAERLARAGANPRAPELPLVGLADHPEYRLATVEECRELARLPNVGLGNHGNAHVEWSGIALEAVREDVLGSLADFERLFGPCSDFAIPFGTPGRSFGVEHLELVRASTEAAIWTTKGGAYRPSERRPSAVLPRFGVDGSWSARFTLALIALRCLRSRGRSSGAPPLPPAGP